LNPGKKRKSCRKIHDQPEDYLRPLHLFLQEIKSSYRNIEPPIICDYNHFIIFPRISNNNE
jgi:hypothetical protein